MFEHNMHGEGACVCACSTERFHSSCLDGQMGECSGLWEEQVCVDSENFSWDCKMSCCEQLCAGQKQFVCFLSGIVSVLSVNPAKIKVSLPLLHQKAGCDLVSISVWHSCCVRVQRTTVEKGLILVWW